MTRARFAIAILGLAVLAMVVAWRTRTGGGDPAAPRTGAHGRTVGAGFAEVLARARGGGRATPWVPPPRLDGAVTVAGTVRDALTAAPVGGVEVVFLGEAGEQSTAAGGDGKYRLDLPPGAYRAFVRDETVLSVGWTDHVRLPGPPSADTVGVPDQALMPLVNARADADGVDLSVMRGGAIHGRVVDRSGRPVANALLRARGELRPTLATDLAETGADGTFELRLPAGGYELEASHPQFAGIASGVHIELEPGAVQTATVTLAAGCVIAGRVVGPSGQLAGDGAIERQVGATDHEFAPAGRIAPDGTFRWVTTEQRDVTLRAWPWKSPPSPGQRFACKDGARYDDVVFELPDRGPDLAGVLVDHAGAPVAFAYVDLAPLDPGGIGQQERTDATGRWAVYQMPPGRYRITAVAPGRGVVAAEARSPQANLRLQLGGTGRIEGTTPALATGSFELTLGSCVEDTATVPLTQDRRLVTITGGRFTVDEVPACDLELVATWHGKPAEARVTVPAAGTAQLELAVGPPRAKTVHGVVRDEAGRPVEGAQVTAVHDDEVATATTDGAGRFALRTFSGANLEAHLANRAGFGVVGSANTDDEEVELGLARDGDLGEPAGSPGGAADLDDDEPPSDPVGT